MFKAFYYLNFDKYGLNHFALNVINIEYMNFFFTQHHMITQNEKQAKEINIKEQNRSICNNTQGYQKTLRTSVV